ncbi:hypothetical protein [Sulfurimonas sp.]|uniref:hypothetical protein n=1 Tax=Sulfurimonas sp. TaxID=2022749 RepID=UPI0039E4FB39
MFSKFYEGLYLKALVNIVIGPSKTLVYIEMLNKEGIVHSYEEEFDTKYLSTEMHAYIQSNIKETPYFYISILDNSTSQGALPTCSKHRTGYFYDLSASEYKCYNDKWTYYTSKIDVYEMEKVYKKIGVDFIFSPFLILANFFKDKINTHLAMFILIEEGALSLSIFENSELLFAEYLDLQVEVLSDDLVIDGNDIEDGMLDEEDSIDLDDIDSIDGINDLDELDSFGDIADLDSIDEIDEFDDTKDVEEELAESEDTQEFPTQESSGLNEDYQRFSLIQDSVNHFYQSEKFESEFIENVYVGDGVGVSGDLKKYLEEEMFLNVYIRHVNLAAELCDMTKMELS